MRISTSMIALAFLVGAGATPVAASTVSPQASKSVSFNIEVQGQVIDYAVFFAAVLPGEILDLQVRGRPTDHDIVFDVSDAGEMLVDDLKLSWKAPETPGHYSIKIFDRKSGEIATLNVFVMTPASEIKDGKLNGYRIGAYPEKPLRGNPVYDKPLGFIEVTPEIADVKISPNFTIGQFLCKQQTSAPAKYIVLRPALLKKLERVVTLLNDAGVETNSLYIMSGYRTPYYNAAIGNVQYSRHVYGDAADIYVDFEPRDGDMDDINGDGKVDKNDAAYLYDLIDNFDRTVTELSVQGGIGSYDRNAVHGPFVHVDVRGAPARWGR